MTAKRIRRLMLLVLAAGILLSQGAILYYRVFFTSPLTAPQSRFYLSWNGPGYKVLESHGEVWTKAGLRKGDVIVAITDKRGFERRLTGEYAFADCVRNISFGEPFTLLVQRKAPDGAVKQMRLDIPAQPRLPSPWRERLPRYAFNLFFTAICLAAGLFIGFARTENDNAFTASLLFLSLQSLTWGLSQALFPPVLRVFGLALFILLLSFMTSLFMRFFLLFPTPSFLDGRLPWLKDAGLVFGGTFTVWNFSIHYLQESDTAAFVRFFAGFRWVDIILDVIYCLLFVLGIVALVGNLFHVRQPGERNRLMILLIGALCILPWLGIYLYQVTIGGLRLPSWFWIVIYALMICFPLAFVYAVVKHRIFGIRVILRRGLRFALLHRGVLFLEGILIFVGFYYFTDPYVSRVLGEPGRGMLAIMTAGATAGIVLGVWRVNRRVMPRIERQFFREAYDARRVLTNLTLKVRRLVADPNALVSTVTGTVFDALHPDNAAVFLRAAEIASLPLANGERKRFRDVSAGKRQEDFFCWWHRSRIAPGEEAPLEVCNPPRILSADSLVVRLMEKDLREELRGLDVDPQSSRSRAELVRLQGTKEENDFLLRTNARLLIPLSADNRLMGFLSLGEKLSEEPYSKEDEDLLLAVAQQAADTLDHARLLHEGHEQTQLKREVEIARQVQENLLPQIVIPVSNLEYTGTCRPARYVGGDYFDFIRGRNGSLGLALGDISGKGVSAALLMAALQATLRVQADTHGGHVGEMVEGINRRMCTATSETRFATLFLGFFDSANRVLNYVNAGHNPPMVFRKKGADLDVLRLESSGTILGVFPDASFDQQSFPFSPGDLLVVYSDGVTEAVNEADEFFEDDRLEDVIKLNAHLPARAIVDSVLREVFEFAGGRPQNDDITIIVAKIT